MARHLNRLRSRVHPNGSGRLTPANLDLRGNLTLSTDPAFT
jgi:hypothetical protein